MEPSSSTCMAPRMERSMWPPRIIAKESAEEKYEAPGRIVTVSLPALMRSGSISSSRGYGPRPRIPFSDWRMTSMSGGMWLAMSVGMPMPRFTVKPSFSSLTARRMMPSRSSMSGFPHRSPLDAFLSRGDDQAVDENAGGMDALRVELPDLDELLDLGDRDLPRGDRHGIEV